MRSKKGNGSTKNSANLRSSVRTTNKIRTNPEGHESGSNATDLYDQQSRPSHYHTYSTTSNDTDYDEEIDMPDAQLLMDHVSRKTTAATVSTIDETDSNDDYQSSNKKYFRGRRSFRGAPKVILDDSEIIHNSSLCSGLDSSFSSSADNLLEGYSQSRESLDIDSISMAPSDLSKYPMDDEESFITDQSRMTPDSTISLSSYSSRPRSKGEIAVLRSRKGKRGGSHIQVATSSFADRHTQFRSNLQKHQLDSYQLAASSTRATSPATSVSSIATHCHQYTYEEENSLKAPNFTFSTNSKHNSVAESTTSDMPHSPVSLVSSPPTTPLVVSSPTPHSHLLRKNMSSSHDEHRESGYISSSSESFAVSVRR